MARAATTANELFNGIISGDRTALARAITLVESTREDQRDVATELLGLCMPRTGSSIRVGITGIPGVGKSTFIDTLGTEITKRGCKVAVLAVDPSSAQHKGSILGDKTRMERLVADANAFIRPSASAGTLGGVRTSTRESIYLCEAAGFDVVLVETVGVGQSETAVHGMVDVFLLLTITGAGDELQGIKRGIMEMADMIIVNKAEAANMKAAERTAKQLSAALHLFPPMPSGWTPEVMLCSSLIGSGVANIWEKVLQYKDMASASHFWEEHRKQQLIAAFREELMEGLHRLLHASSEIAAMIKAAESDIKEGKSDPFAAAAAILRRMDSTLAKS